MSVMSMPCTPSALLPAKVWHLMQPKAWAPTICRPAALIFASGSLNFTAGITGSLSLASKIGLRWPTLADPKPGMRVCMYGRSWAPTSRICLT